MKHQNYNHRARVSGALMSAALLLALTCSSIAAGAADRVQVTPINGNEGVASVVEGRAEGASHQSASGFAHLLGHAEYSRSRGLMVAGQHVNFTRSTSVFPSVDGLSSGLRSRQLSGRELTIFGTLGPNGVDAVLVIVKPSAADIDRSWSSALQVEQDQSFVPSTSDPRVGSAPSGSPE